MAGVGGKTGPGLNLSRPRHVKKSSQFPRINKRNHSIESDLSPRYNCIAFAAGVDSRKWWPAFHPDAYWPPGVPFELTLSAFERVFATLGYVKCYDGAHHQNVEKIAIYTKNGVPTHAARQVGPDTWASKLGNSYDIEHKIDAVSGGLYGQVAAFMERPVRGP